MTFGAERLLGQTNIIDNFLEVLESLYSSEEPHSLKHALDVEEKAIRVWEIAILTTSRVVSTLRNFWSS